MSTRSLRKMCGNMGLPPPDSDDPDSNFEPVCNRQKPIFTYDGLEVSSDSDEPQAEEVEDTSDPVASTSGGAKKKNKKKTGRRRRRFSRAETEGLDEIDISVMEVNALLGAPPPAPVVKAKPVTDPLKIVSATETKHLNVCNELRRLFGPEEPEEIRLRNKTQPYRVRFLKRVLITPNPSVLIYDYKKTGLSMSILKRVDDIIYFVYDHDSDRQKVHAAYLEKYRYNNLRQRQSPTFLGADDAKKNMHVEALLEVADTLFAFDEFSTGNEIVENIITYLQYVAHPSFNLASTKVRLLYSYLENRPFHVAMLKYMYLLSNKACHRTALEIAKMLMNIDPSDPLAVLFVIDTIALRAREHQWLIDAIDCWTEQRQANLLFNIQYSYALAHFHVATKNKKKLTEADTHLQNAILGNPHVVTKLLEFCSTNDTRITEHELFVNDAKMLSRDDGISQLIHIYTRLSYSRWRETKVLEWLIKNALQVCVNYDNHEEIRDSANECAAIRYTLFQDWPVEIYRHYSVIYSMANLLLETPLIPLNRITSSWDPLFDNCINRYSYVLPGKDVPPRDGSDSLLYRFFTSILPNTEFEPPVE